MKCPYVSKVICDYVDTLGMTQTKECLECENYQPLHDIPDDRIRPTGATPVLAWFLDLFKKKNKAIKPSESGKRGRTSEDPHQLMYECTCKHCGSKFSSSVPGFDCCPTCYV